MSTLPFAPPDDTTVDLVRDDRFVAHGLVVAAQSDFGDACITVDFAHAAAIELPVGASARVRFRGGVLGGPRTLTGRVTFHSADAIRHRYQFLFPGEGLRSLGPLVNQRGAVRVQPSEDEPVGVVLRSSAEDEPHVAQVLDVSGTGLSLQVTPKVEEALTSCWQPRITITLPHDSTPLELVGCIRHRRLTGEGVKYGVEFLSSGSIGYENLRERIYRFVMAKNGRDVGGFDPGRRRRSA